MVSEQITLKYEDEEFTFSLDPHGQIHIFVKEIWWSVGDDATEVGPYIQALEQYQKRLAALRENGWNLTLSDGEHLYFEHEDVDSDSTSEWEVTDELE